MACTRGDGSDAVVVVVWHNVAWEDSSRTKKKMMKGSTEWSWEVAKKMLRVSPSSSVWLSISLGTSVSSTVESGQKRRQVVIS